MACFGKYVSYPRIEDLEHKMSIYEMSTWCLGWHIDARRPFRELKRIDLLISSLPIKQHSSRSGEVWEVLFVATVLIRQMQRWML